MEYKEPIYAICQRRWWLGGGYDVVQGPGWPLRLAWFKERDHAIAFIRIFSKKWADANAE